MGFAQKADFQAGELPAWITDPGGECVKYRIGGENS
jgi:hypothetical protein